MNPDLLLALRHAATRRAHLAGAEAMHLEREAARLLEAAKSARRRYFRELTAVDDLGGHSPSPFAHLG